VNSTGRPRPTARQGGRFDLSATPTRASAVADNPEERLFRAYDAPRVRRVESCVCGGRLVQFQDDSPGEVVAIHQSTAVHRGWRERVGL
jgi:hypothetical protein